jgi:ABC-2 type transport system permease protein
VSLLVAAGLAFYMSVRTDAPLGAVGTAVVIVIVMQILDAISALGDLRQWLPGHYSQAWTDALNPTVDWTNMARGGAYAFALFALFVALAVLKFDRKDVTS